MKLVRRNLLAVSILWLAPICEANLNRGKKLESFLRHLEDDKIAIPPQVPPSRECGQVINLTTVAQIKVVASALLSILLPEAQVAFATSAVESIIKYDVHAQVVCASCNEMRSLYDGSDFMIEDGRHAFMSYCGNDRFAADVTHSALLLIPHDPETGKPIEGILKSHLYTKGYSGAEQSQAPSEFWLDDFSAFNTTDKAVVGGLLNRFYDGWTALITASAGVVVMSPDYLGYGQSYQTPKGTGVIGLYQQAAAVTFLKSKSIVESTSCTIIGSETSASGYSEGGAAAFSGALALEGLGQEILNVDTGGAPFRPSFQFTYSVDQIDRGTEAHILRDFFAILTSVYSSKIPDLPNSNMGQDMLNAEWRDLIVSLADTNLKFGVIGPYLPIPATDIVNGAFLEKARGLLARNITDVCFTSTTGVDDLLCQAIEENTLIDLVESTTFPTSICHSPNDEAIPIGNAPDVSINPLLSTLTLLGQGPTGRHGESSFICQMAYILQFSAFGSAPAPLSGIEPLTDPSMCTATVSPVSDVAPATPAPAIMVAPATLAPTQSEVEPPFWKEFVAGLFLFLALVLFALTAGKTWRKNREYQKIPSITLVV